jgi:hypothetical protein
MAVVNVHSQPAPDQRELTLRSAWFFGRPRLASPKFWLTGIGFLALYLACNKLTEWHQFDGLAITLWSSPFCRRRAGAGRAMRWSAASSSFWERAWGSWYSLASGPPKSTICSICCFCLWWEPEVPEGTRFLVALPINGPDKNAA